MQQGKTIRVTSCFAATLGIANLPSDPSKSSDCGHHHGSTKHPANESTHGENHNGLDSNSKIGRERLQVALSVEEVPLVVPSVVS